MLKIGQVVKEEILDEQEKEYLRAVIKPFRQKVKYIEKVRFFDYDIEIYTEYINIELDGDTISLPTFRKMCKGMEVKKEYSLEDLEL